MASTDSSAPAPTATALTEILTTLPPPAPGNQRRLLVVWGQLGDFDSFEYAQALVQQLPELDAAGIDVQALAIGNQAGWERFCCYTGFPAAHLHVQPDNTWHQRLGLYAGLQTPAGAWPNLLLMCAGIGSPGTLAEVLRGYTGDRRAGSRLNWPLFELAGSPDVLRPFELATVRLQNMVEVLGRWRTYVPSDAFLTQRGGTFLLDADQSLLYVHRDRGILGFSASMHNPLGFLEAFLRPCADQAS